MCRLVAAPALSISILNPLWKFLMYELAALLTLILSSSITVHIAGARGKIDSVLLFFCVATAQISVSGHILSFMNHLAEVRGWALLGIMFFAIVSGMALARRQELSSMIQRLSLRMLRGWSLNLRKWYFDELRGFEKLLLTPMILVTLLLCIFNLAVILLSAPNNFDGMTHHLARMAYYLQHNSLDYFPANYWPQVAKMKNGTILLIYSYLMSGGNENMTRLPQFISYVIAICSVFGIARKMGHSITHSLFASLVSSLLISWVLESGTTQNDLIVTAYLGAALYFLFAFREARRSRYLAFTALAIGLALGISAKTFLSLPPFVLVAYYVLYPKEARHHLAHFALYLFVAFVSLSLPAGYLANYHYFGHPIEPDVGDEKLQHITLQENTPAGIVKNGSKNILRFGFDFLALDGLPPVDPVLEAQSIMRAIPKRLVTTLGIDLESSEDVIKPFRYQKPYIFFAHEGWSSWGVLGFALIWLAVFLSAIGVMGGGIAKILSYASILFLCTVAYGLSYEPHITRYFVMCAVFAAPVVAVIMCEEKKFLRVYVLVIVLLGCISALTAVVLRPARPLVSMKDLSETFPQIRRFEFLSKSIFQMERIEQMTSNARSLYPAIRTFDLLVPEEATVAAFLYIDTYEYPLFGKELTRTIVPINSDLEGFKGVPEYADYLLYVEGFPEASTEDLYLGSDWYLRVLKDSEAIAFYKKLMMLKPDRAPYHNRLGVAYAKIGRLDDALEEFKIAVGLDPDEPSYRRNLDRTERMFFTEGKPGK